jgi:hypothetical protein
MKSLAFLATAGALPLALGNAFAPASSSAEPKGVLRFPVKRAARSPYGSDSNSKRQFGVPSNPQVIGNYYTIDIRIGTPGQTVSVAIDTGSDELWVNPICVKSNYPTLCLESGRFTASSTYFSYNVQGGKQYPWGYVEFEYGADFIGIGR